jgi:pimeloyl-ACP methyl ester carboxylesterase
MTDVKKPVYLPSMFAPWLNPQWRPPASTRATIIMVHGAVVDGYETFLLRRRLRQLGYQTSLFQWRSMMRSLEHNVDQLAKFIRSTEGDIVHVVGHSMGGVLTRQVFEQTPDPRPGRLVAIGSPLLDCWVGRRFQRLHPHIGPLMIGRTVLDHIMNPPSPVWGGARDFGVVAGTYPFGIGAIFSSLPNPSDGVVLLEETQLQGARDHVAYRINHFGLLASKRCTAQVACFLATGGFYEDISRNDATTEV